MFLPVALLTEPTQEYGVPDGTCADGRLRARPRVPLTDDPLLASLHWTAMRGRIPAASIRSVCESMSCRRKQGLDDLQSDQADLRQLE